MDDDKTINSHGIYTFVAASQLYHKIIIASNPIEKNKGKSERPQHGQMYSLESDDAVAERIKDLLKHCFSITLI